jgi:hypothetical protein
MGKRVMTPFLQYRGSRPGLFSDLSMGESCPLRILDSVELRFPPLISQEKTAASRQAFQKRHHHPEMRTATRLC